MKKRVFSLLLAMTLLSGLVGCGSSGSSSGTGDGTTAGSAEPTVDSVGTIEGIEAMGTVFYVKANENCLVDESTVNAVYDDLDAAMKEAKKLLDKANKNEPVTVTIVLSDGVHKLSGTSTISAKSVINAQYATLNIVANEGARPVITGAEAIDTGKFTKVEGTDYYLYQFEADEDGKFPIYRDLWVDGVRAPIAESEIYKHGYNFENPSDHTDERNKKGLYVDKELAEKLGEDMAACEMYLSAEWEFYVVHVEDIDFADVKEHPMGTQVRAKINETEITDWVRTYNKACLSILNRDYTFMNHPALIDEGGEYAYDHKTGRLWYRPQDGKSITDAELSMSDVDVLLKLNNMKNVTLQGITFTGVSCDQLPKKGYLSGQANQETRDGVLKTAAVYAQASENIVIRGCNFYELGSNGVMFRTSSAGATVLDCRFKNIAMSAIKIGEHTTNWGPQTSNTDVTIKNNLVEHVGYEYPSSVAICVSIVKGAKILNNTVRDVAYSGFSIGWGWGYADFKYGESYRVNDVEIAYNRIENFMQKTRDGGAIYVLGSSAEASYYEYFNFMHDNYCYLENGDGGQRGYYLDESSGNWHVYDNVSLGASVSMFLQHVAGTPVRNILAERLYADKYSHPNNHAPGRNVIVQDLFIDTDLFATYPEAKTIADAAGCDLAD